VIQPTSTTGARQQRRFRRPNMRYGQTMAPPKGYNSSGFAVLPHIMKLFSRPRNFLRPFGNFLFHILHRPDRSQGHHGID